MAVKKSTDVPLRDYLERCITALEKSILYEHDAGRERDLAYRTQSELVAASLNQRFEAIYKETALAREVNDTRLEGMNEFRQSINDLIAHLISRIEVEDKITALMTVLDAKETRISVLEKTIANFEGRLLMVGGGIGVFSILVSVALHFLP
jgi:hypothetical protein